jgi:hypothetical protein
LRAGADLFVDRLNHVDGHANGARLVGDGASNRLADPPGCVGGKLVATAPFKFVGTSHQTDIAFLNQIQKLQPSVRIFLCDRNDEAKVCFRQFLFCLLGVGFATKNNRERAFQVHRGRLAGLFDFSDLRAARTYFLAAFGGGFAARGVGATLQPCGFMLQGLQSFDGMANQVDETLSFAFLEMNGAHQMRHRDACPAQLASCA